MGSKKLKKNQDDTNLMNDLTPAELRELKKLLSGR